MIVMRKGINQFLFINFIFLSSIAWGVLAQSPEPGAHVLHARAFRIELEFRNGGFCGEGKTEYPEKNLSEQRREPTTNSTHIWRRVRESNPGHIGGRRVLSPLRPPCSPYIAYIVLLLLIIFFI